MTQQDTMPGKRLAELLTDKWLPADVGDVAVNGLCLDHRQLASGDLFIAVAGTRTDGRRFVNEAVAAGAAGILKEADSEEERILWHGPVPIIPYIGLAQAASAIAGHFYGNPSRALNVIGITGTNGKSTCAHLLAQLFGLLGKPAAVMGTLGYGKVGQASSTTKNLIATGLTTADPVANQRILAALKDEGVEAVAMEVSSHSLDQHRVAGMQFSAALFTNLSHDHLDYHNDMAEYGRAKRKLFLQPGLRDRVINIDDTFGRELVASLSSTRESVKTWTYSLHDTGADLYLDGIQHQQTSVRARVQSPWGSGRFNTELLGDFNLSNVLGAIAICCAQGHDLQSVLQLIATLKPVTGRMERVPGGGDLNVVVDYAHTPDSLEQALKALRDHTAGKLWCVFGCGGDRDKGKRPLMAAAAEQFADTVIVTSDNPRGEAQSQIAAGIRAGFSAPQSVTFVEDRAAAIRAAIEQAQPGDCVLIAGKGHETYQQVGDNRLPFSDVKQARLALQARRAKDSGSNPE